MKIEALGEGASFDRRNTKNHVKNFPEGISDGSMRRNRFLAQV